MNFFWFFIFTFYLWNLIIFFYISWALKLKSLALCSLIYNHSNVGKLFIIFFFFNLIGVPLTPGFFLKFYIFSKILIQFNSLWLMSILICINFIFFYFYLKSLKLNLKSKPQTLINLPIIVNFLLIFTLFINISFHFSWFIFLL